MWVDLKPGEDELGEQRADMPHRRRHKKNAARRDSDGVFHFIELPKGKDSFLTKRRGV